MADDKRLIQIHKRLTDATSGPWSASYVGSPRSHCTTAIYSHDPDLPLGHEVLPSYPYRKGYGRMSYADAELIANAPSDIDYLLGLVEELTMELEQARRLAVVTRAGVST